LGDKIKKNEIGEACSTMREILVGKPGGKSQLEDSGVDGRIILRWIFRKWDGGSMNWVDLGQKRDS
jgi:hypothetical protein